MRIDKLKLLDFKFVDRFDKYLFFFEKYLPEDTHLTFHSGGDSGYMDVHLTHQKSENRITLFIMKIIESTAIFDLILKKLFIELSNIYQIKTPEELKSEIDKFLDMGLNPEIETLFEKHIETKIKKNELRILEQDLTNDKFF